MWRAGTSTVIHSPATFRVHDLLEGIGGLNLLAPEALLGHEEPLKYRAEVKGGTPHPRSRRRHTCSSATVHPFAAAQLVHDPLIRALAA
jgi:hypothetical protein